MTAPAARRSRIWWPRAALVAAGLAAAAAQPPWGFLPGLFGFSVLLWTVDRSVGAGALRSAFFRGWLAGLAYFIVSLWWLYEPFQVDAADQGWMAPFAVIAVSALLAIFWGAGCALYRALAAEGPRRALLFAAAMGLAEWLRGHVLTGLPWNPAGAAWVAGSAPSQAAALVGIWGLTVITLAIAAAPAVVGEGAGGRRLCVAALAGLVALYLFGAARLAGQPRADPAAPWVRLVQADVRQEAKYDPRQFAAIVGRYVALTARPSPHPIDIVVWPEGAIPAAMDDYLAPGAWTRAAILAALAPGQTLLLGGYRFGGDSLGRPVTYNSLAALRRTPGGLALLGVYDKFRLVPFGEFMPLDGLASRLGIKQMVHVGDGFSPGPRPRPMSLPGLPTVQPLICYESLFSGFTREGARASGRRAAWIVNVSNDAWFGAGSGPRQHLNLASYRAIEEGLPMVRATPTGISAVIDAFGRIDPRERLDHGAIGVLDEPLPAALPPTVFDTLGDAGFWLIVLVGGLAGAGRRRDRYFAGGVLT